MERTSRRRFLQMSLTGFMGSALFGTAGGFAQSSDRQGSAARGKAMTGTGLKLGLASYTFRHFDLDQTIAMTRRLGLSHICFKSFHLPLESSEEQIRATALRVKEAGLDLYSCGVVYMKNEAEIQQAFTYARAAGMGMIVGVPDHGLLERVNRKVQEFNIKLAIHNHGPGDELYPTPQSVFEKIQHLDTRIGLCIDIGHTARSGIDPSRALETYANRLLDVHIKDVSAATADGNTVEMGRGVIDIPTVVRTLLMINYQGITSFEFEKDKEDPLPGVAESVGYVRGVLDTIG